MDIPLTILISLLSPAILLVGFFFALRSDQIRTAERTEQQIKAIREIMEKNHEIIRLQESHTEARFQRIEKQLDAIWKHINNTFQRHEQP